MLSHRLIPALVQEQSDAHRDEECHRIVNEHINSVIVSRDAHAIQKAQTPAARKEVKKLQKMAKQTLAEAEDLKERARLEDLQVWEMEKVKESKKGSKKYTYWVASWREDDKVRNVHLGSCRKLSKADAIQKARKLKAEALGLRHSE